MSGPAWPSETNWVSQPEPKSGFNILVASAGSDLAQLIDTEQTIIVHTSNPTDEELDHEVQLEVQKLPRKRPRKEIVVQNVNTTEKDAKRQKFIEAVAAFKCKLCDFLGLTVSDVEGHLMTAHEDDYFDHNDWLEIAKKEDIRLQCPKCDNNFISEGSRSFKVHMMDDHGDSEQAANELFDKQTSIRRSKALILLKEQKELRKIKRSAYLNKQMEAYVDVKGELRVRTAQDDQDEFIDVPAAKYFDVVKEGKEDVKLVKNDAKSSKTSKQTKPAHNVGRKRGSKTVGISKLQLVNPNIKMSEEILGSACNVGRCGVRLVNKEKLEYHRSKCHDNQEFICPECKNVRVTGVWSKIAMHLWREHQIDMELLTCPECPTFRAFNRARLADHMTKHKTERPHKCPQCEQAFKHDRHLRDHLVRGHGKQREYEANLQSKKFQCRICDRVFKDQKALLTHIKNVHEGVKPFVCRFCNYCTSNRSNLIIHERQHTGEKPYSCEFCEYRSVDRNSLNKHVMRHTGEKKFFCKICDFATIQAVNLGYHYNSTHHDESVTSGLLKKCSLCKYFTIREESFAAHMSKQHQDSPWPGIDPKEAGAKQKVAETKTME